MNQPAGLSLSAVCVVGVGLGLLSSSCGGDAQESAIPAGCEVALAKRTGGQSKCRAQAQCEHVRAHPEEVVSFYFNLYKMTAGEGESFPTSERLHNRQCVADFLRAHGVTKQEADTGLNDVAVSASYKQVQAAFDLAIVNEIELGCRNDDACTHCAALSETACGQEPFCAVRPSELDPSRRICDIYGRLTPN
jgi:hypothetical protein